MLGPFTSMQSSWAELRDSADSAILLVKDLSGCRVGFTNNADLISKGRTIFSYGRTVQWVVSLFGTKSDII